MMLGLLHAYSHGIIRADAIYSRLLACRHNPSQCFKMTPANPPNHPPQTPPAKGFGSRAAAALTILVLIYIPLK